MKKLLISSLLVGAILSGASAQTGAAPSDVPRGHWAFEAVDTLFRLGLLTGYPSTERGLEFRGNRPASRYEMAGALHKMRLQFASTVSQPPGQTVLDRTAEADLRALRQAVETLRRDVEALKSQGAELPSLKTRFSDIGEKIRRLREEIRSMRGHIRSSRG